MIKVLLPIVIICAVVFLLCFLIDRLIRALRPKSGLGKGVKFVRMPRRSFIFGIILLLFPVAAVLFWLPKDETLLRVGCGVIFAMGILLLYYFFSFSIRYDGQSFEYRDLRHKRTSFTYDQIKGQRSVTTRSGVQTVLFVGDDSLMLSEAMQGVNEFLSTAFFKWCDLKGIDPDSIENNPHMLTYFPDPEPEET